MDSKFTAEESLLKEFKEHIRFEDGMDDSLMPLYLKQARKYVLNASDRENKVLIFMIAGLLHEARVPEKTLNEALDAMTPFFVQEAVCDGNETEN